MSYTIGDGLVALALAGAFIGYFGLIHDSRRKRLEVIHQERLVAMDKGIPLPELPLESPSTRREADTMTLLIMGVAFFTLGLGAMIVLYVSLPVEMHSLWVAPLPLTFLGIGLVACHYLKGRPGY